MLCRFLLLSVPSVALKDIAFVATECSLFSLCTGKAIQSGS
jgi:hypothetical protein